MYCSKCGGQIETRGTYCGHCGTKLKKNKLLQVVTIGLVVACIGVFFFIGKEFYSQELSNEPVVKSEVEKVSQPVEEPAPVQKEIVTKLVKEEEANLTEVIASAQEKVFTVFTDYSQGSSFLINEQGDLLTNAHVVEGAVNVVVRDKEGTDYEGRVIGYSNDIDIAIIRVNGLKGKAPLALERENSSTIGEEVIALGSPRGLENTATFGHISGTNRSFVIPPHTYEGIYQISAPIAPGNSGGPLLNRKTGHVLAINSARHSEEVQIGFSIPIYQIATLIDEWIDSPMSEQEIMELFYNASGLFFYQELYGNEGYFEDGDYNEDYNYYDEWSYEEDSGYDEEDTYLEDEGYDEEDTYLEDEGYDEEETYPEDDSYDEEETYPEDDSYDEEETYPEDDGYYEEDTYPEDDSYNEDPPLEEETGAEETDSTIVNKESIVDEETDEELEN
ncbi:trypsin-like peptidase domain-containing protein [Metabacillus iocasae]|uniref:S1-C subfamily serine protease n=1 Tax=Priestia iocasae TaxID=2291674 RepID=A0ABS2QSN6_9BACI|nr:trypsin-like peptidase domain-containing protein [Metabacillus iocasae]MBM7702476.1 S1-C subfamily serine protease [Metabacillus iocasae]